jgi:PilZ domain
MSQSTPSCQSCDGLQAGSGADDDRRRHTRNDFVRPCKVQRSGHVRYEAGQTSNISTSGALLRIAREPAIRTGETIRVGVAWESGGVLASGSLLPARVVRVIPIDFHHQAVAVEYCQPAASAAQPFAAAA